jgi:hypothetical protein
MLDIGHLVDGRAAELSHAFRDAVHPVNVGLTELAAVRVDRQPAADLDRPVGDEVLCLTPASGVPGVGTAGGADGAGGIGLKSTTILARASINSWRPTSSMYAISLTRTR